MRGSGDVAPLFLTSALERSVWADPFPCPFTHKETGPGTHCIGEWVDRRASLNIMENRKISCCYWESNPNSSVIQLVTIPMIILNINLTSTML
jgi:hypothetical protein